jgi:shikimate kinase
MTTRHIVLLGLMGTGKTSIGRVVSGRIGAPLVDGDEVLEHQYHATAAEVAAERGLEALHSLEAEIALQALAAGTESVIAPAASVCESAAVRQALHPHHVVWLTASAEFLASKVRNKAHRPLVGEGDPEELLRQQASMREPLVMALAPIVIHVETTSDEEAADIIVDHVRQHP